MHATRAPYLQHHKEPFGPYTYTQEKIITRFWILTHRYDYGHIHNQNHHQAVQCKMIIRATEALREACPFIVACFACFDCFVYADDDADD